MSKILRIKELDAALGLRLSAFGWASGSGLWASGMQASGGRRRAAGSDPGPWTSNLASGAGMGEIPPPPEERLRRDEAAGVGLGGAVVVGRCGIVPRVAQVDFSVNV